VTATAVDTMTYRQAVIDAQRQAMLSDPTVWLLGEDMAGGGPYGATLGLYDEFGPERVRGTPISESAIVGFSVGAAMTGTRPVAELYHMDFVTCAMDQIVNQLAKMRYMTGGQASVPVTIRCAVGGWQRGAAQHSQSLEAWFTHVPGLKVAAPAEPADVKGALLAAIRDDDPVIVLEAAGSYETTGQVPAGGDHELPAGTALAKRHGEHVTVLTWGAALGHVMTACEQLERDGVEAEVMDLVWLHPFDRAAVLEAIARTGRVVIVHQANRRGGYGAELAAFIHEEAAGALKAPVRRVAARNVPVPFAPELEDHVMPGAERIAAEVHHLMDRS
jgi:pyruvate/2-oxoglutarate/acetoin dehydrogenase E1 component